MEQHYPELPNILEIIARKYEHAAWSGFLHTWQDVIYAAAAGLLLVVLSWRAGRNAKEIPGRLQNFFEFYVQTMRDFVAGMLGSKGDQYLPFIGTLFIYILTMNLMGFIPFLKSPTTNLATTAAMSICVFFYLQYTSFKVLGVRGYLDHLMGSPRGAMAMTVILPLFMLVLHMMSELVRPLTLALRLRSTLWGDDLLLAIFAGFGLPAFLLLFLNFVLALMTAFIQAFVFTILTMVYFALVVVHEE
jgi:F-type H+-transporting ATPase subunit a